MTTLNVATQGIGYLRACLNQYADNCAFFVLYLLALVFVCIKGSRIEKRIFLPAAALLLVTVYNPLFPLLLMRFFDVNNEYYRFFWIAPVIVLVPFVTVKLILIFKDTKSRVLMSAFLILIYLLSGNFLYRNGYQKAENVYKMPGEMMEVSDLIHADTAAVYPKVFLEYEYNMQMRQYDPKMLLTVNREDYLYALSSDYTDAMLAQEDHPEYQLLAALARKQLSKVDVARFKAALEETHTEYVVVQKGAAIREYLQRAGLVQVAETKHHGIYRYTLSEPYVFELVDYTPVY